MDLESVVTQNEVVRKQKSKYCLLTHMWDQESGTDEPVSRVGIEMQMKRRMCGHDRGARRTGPAGENRTVRATTWQIDSWQEAAVEHRESSLVLCNDVDGWDGRWK